MKKIKISELPQSNSIQGLFTIGTDSQNRSVKVPLGEVINDEIRKVKRTYNYSRIDALSETSSSDAVAMALTAEGENKPTSVPTVGDILVDWSGVTRVPVVRQSVKTGGEKPIYSFSYRTADNTATKTVTIQGYLYEPQTVVGVETVKDVTQQQVTSLDTQLAEEATARLNQDDVLEAKITDETTARTNADKALGKRIDAEQTARTSADKVLTDNLAKEVDNRAKAITAEQTARTNADVAIRTDIQGIKDKGSLHDLFVDCGATWDNSKQKYLLNGLELTVDEMIRCYVGSANIWQADDYANICNSTKFKTTIKAFALKNFNVQMNASNMFCYSAIIVADLWYINRTHRCLIKNASEMFKGCRYLTSIYGLNAKGCVNVNSFYTAFKLCTKLKNIDMINLSANVDFSDSSLLTKESVISLVQNATPPSAITITLHPTVYAMATADPEIQAELEKQPNISLAEGTPSV